MANNYLPPELVAGWISHHSQPQLVQHTYYPGSHTVPSSPLENFVTPAVKQFFVKLRSRSLTKVKPFLLGNETTHLAYGDCP